MLIEKQRSEQEVASLRLFMDEERKEMAEMRRQQQEVLNAEGGEPLSLMYSQLLQNYENVKKLVETVVDKSHPSETRNDQL